MPSAVAGQPYAEFMRSLLASPPGGAEARPDIEAALLMLVNNYRQSRGAKPLAPADGLLLDAARAHALDLLAMGKMGHVASTGHNFESRMRALHPGEMLLPVMAENAARERHEGLSAVAKAQAIVEQWINSPPHRKSMVNRSYMSVATGAVMLGDTVYAVQIFSGPVVKSNFHFGGPQLSPDP